MSNTTSEDSPLIGGQRSRANSLTLLFEKPENEQQDPNQSSTHKDGIPSPAKKRQTKLFSCKPQDVQNTLVGSVVFLLYQVVFCLAQAATITRPHSNSHSNTGIMAQMAALGIMTSGPLFLYELSQDVPAIYPASDLFLAPFLAILAQDVDYVLYQHGLQDDDKIFLATFGMLLTVGFLGSGSLCILAARVKLANLGAFLPYSVLCGFFATIGILMWTLGFKIDVGQKVGQVLMSGDWKLMGRAAMHHFPSLSVGAAMHVLGPKNPLFVVMLVCATIVGSYVIMWFTGTSLAEAQAQNWFFTAEDLIPDSPTLSLQDYSLPAPFGMWVSLWRGDVYWDAFFAGLPTVIALVFLYLVRSSLHSAAVKKNIPLVTRKPEPGQQESIVSFRPQRVKRGPLTLGHILEHGYGYSQLLTGFVGGITVAPSVAASLTLFKLRAETPPPQYGSCILVILFYFSNFTLVQYIPKPAFSSLMVLAGLDMIRRWIFDSFRKTKSKLEWCVAPLLVLLAFTIGVLSAIFVGVALSTFIFAANFYKAGAVKFVGNGLTLRSTVERGVREDEWLDQHGDCIQILVIQNYLFFGNGQSLLTYITTMFEDEDDDPMSAMVPLPPKPKYLVIDFCLVSGMDTSAVDIIQEIVTLCTETNRCKLYLSGLNPSLKSTLIFAGLRGNQRLGWIYTMDMETALAKAEDGLLSTDFRPKEIEQEENRKRGNSIHPLDGFLYALKKIDEQHGLNTCKDLAELAPMTTLVELDSGDILVRDTAPGLYFVESGLLRVQWSTSNTTHQSTHPNSETLDQFDNGNSNQGSNNRFMMVPPENEQSIGHLNARSATAGREMLKWKEQHYQQAVHHHTHEQQSFRLARIGQGWIIGSLEASNGMKKPGVHIAMSPCRLHHLPESAIEKLRQAENPRIAMNLYRVLSHLSTKRQEMTIEHLGQHLRILNSPVPRLRGRGRAGLALLQQNPLGNNV